MLCPSCNHEVPEEYQYCLQCGAELRDDTLVLPKTVAAFQPHQPTIAVTPQVSNTYEMEESKPPAESHKLLWLAVVVGLAGVALLAFLFSLAVNDQPLEPRRERSVLATPIPTLWVPTPATSPSPIFTQEATPSSSAFEAVPNPGPSPTVRFDKWECWQAVAAFKAAGLEVQTPLLIKEEELKNSPVPMTMKEGIHFFIGSVCPECGARVFSFAAQSDLDQVRRYYVNLGKSGDPFFSWVFVKDNILVQLNGKLPEERARQYENALNNLETSETTR